jgi:hypothetical protein
MEPDQPVDLVRLADDEKSVVVRVLGRYQPGVLTLHDHLRAEIVVSGGFAHGRLDVCLAPYDLQDWEHALDALAAGQDIRWMGDRAPELRIELGDEPGVLEIVVEDEPQSMTMVRVPLVLPAGWIDDQRVLLREIRRVWPSEVVETSPNAYQWRQP